MLQNILFFFHIIPSLLPENITFFIKIFLCPTPYQNLSYQNYFFDNCSRMWVIFLEHKLFILELALNPTTFYTSVWNVLTLPFDQLNMSQIITKHYTHIIESSQMIPTTANHSIFNIVNFLFTIEFPSLFEFLYNYVKETSIYVHTTNQTFTFVFKLATCLVFLSAIRGGVPRYRYDFLTKMGWVKFLGLVLSLFLVVMCLYLLV